MCVFKLPINSFAISNQMFDVACYPWRVHGESLDLIVTILLGKDLSAALSIISEKSCIF